MAFRLRFLLLSGILLAAGCSYKTQQTEGEHNLSKGKCHNIAGKSYDKSVQYTCEMIGGTFQPRKR